MALVKVGLFATAGHTEMGGLQRFLERAFPGVRFERCFPARDRRLPLAREVRPAPRPEDEGVTGQTLVDRMLEIVQTRHQAGGYSAYLLVDDADCRFCSRPSAVDEWADTLRYRLAELRIETPLHVLLAFQEVETWLLADWNRTFGAEFPALAGLSRWGELEHFGCPQAPSGQGCTLKISEVIQDQVRALVPGGTALTYSKRVHGQAMLQRLDPGAVASRCPRFRVDLRRLGRAFTPLPRGRQHD